MSGKRRTADAHRPSIDGRNIDTGSLEIGMHRRTHRVVFAAALSLGLAPGAFACGLYSLVGDVCTVAMNYCPPNSLPADGRLLQISENPALYSLMGTTYGGNGTTTFALPDLRGRVVAHRGQGPDLAKVDIGEAYGNPNLSIGVANLPPHTHTATSSAVVAATLRGTQASATSPDPAGNTLATSAAVPAPPKGSTAPATNVYGYSSQAANVNMDSSAVVPSVDVNTTIAPAGDGKPLPAAQPTLAMLQCIVVNGYFPTQARNR